MATTDKDCIICMDVMSIKTHLLPLNKMIGFHRCKGTRLYAPANCVLVIIARGIRHNWKQPVAYFFVHNSCDVQDLHYVITTSIRKLRHVGLNVLALVSDQGPNFYKFCNELGVNMDKPYFFIDESKIYYIFDTPHLLKSTRNNLFKYDFKLGKNVIKKQYIEDLFNFDVGKTIRLVLRVSDIHINPSPLQKMKVSLAAQILSHSVACAMEALVTFNLFSSDARQTAEFIGDMDKLFNILNSSNFKSTKILNTPYQGSEEQENHLLKSLSIFENLKVFEGNKEITNNVKFLKGWRQTITAVLMLWDDLRPRVKFMRTRFMNLEASEIFYENIGSRGRYVRKPTPIQFERLYKKIFCHQFFKHVDSGT